MSMFGFQTSRQTEPFLDSIARAMVSRFGITMHEAIGRMNRHWQGQSIVDADDVLFHEDETYWANTVYYGKASRWWEEPEGLAPLPYEEQGK